ncbi:hypothetical protein ACFV3E_27735 [Streptomyces sp. NPDC059718]
MTRGTGPAPHADPGRARDCRTCRGWGTLVTGHDGLALCPVCQLPRQRSCPAVPHAEDPPPRRAARYSAAAAAVRCRCAGR